ncbi:MAG: ATP F0F1 synthase subunit B [Rhizobiales bacterium]|nr:ATP F0F1 synthase subunit B [Hyphomicrobiales bacterium]
MPQFNIPDYAPQVIWLAIVFITFYLVMARLALPRIADVLEQRRDRIQRDLDEAERLKGETEQAITAYEQALAEARGKAHVIAQDNRERLTADVERERQETERQLDERLTAAEARIQATKAAALSEVTRIGSETAGAIVERLIGASPSDSELATAAARNTPRR